MTKLLERALAEVSKLPDTEQDAVARWLLEELASERRWDEAFAASHEVMERLADEAVAEHHQGRAPELDLDRL